MAIIALLATSIPADLSWAAKSSQELPSVGSGRVSGPGLIKELNVDTFAIPEYLGHVKDAWKPLQRGARGEGRGAIIHIQDAHCNYAAQHSIARLIEYLNKNYGIEVVNLEGGAGDYDLSIFTRIADKGIRERVADDFVKEGLVNGAEYFAINHPEKVTLWGVEDPELYLENLTVYRESLKYKEVIDKHLKALSHILSNLKIHIYSKELLELDSKYAQYKADNLEFKDYLTYLIQTAKVKAIDIKSFANIYLLNQSLEQETKIDFKKANLERDHLIDRLQKILSRNEIDELVLKSLEFKTEKLSQAEFYAFLIGKTKEVNITMDDFPELQKYIVYITLYKAIDKTSIMQEIESLENRLKEILCKNDIQKDLNVLSKHLALLKNIFNITLTKDDYKYYRANEDNFVIQRYTKFIDKYTPIYNISAKLEENVVDLDHYRQNILRFYECSLKRDMAFIKNMRFSVSGERLSEMNEQTENRKPQTANRITILVTGGFHTENLAKLLKENDISYISLMPNFKNKDEYESQYFKLLAGEMSRMDKRLYSAISSVTTSPQSSLMQIASPYSDKIGLRVWGDRMRAYIARKALLGEEYYKGNVYVVDLGGGERYVYREPAGDTAKVITITELLTMTGRIAPIGAPAIAAIETIPPATVMPIAAPQPAAVTAERASTAGDIRKLVTSAYVSAETRKIPLSPFGLDIELTQNEAAILIESIKKSLVDLSGMYMAVTITPEDVAEFRRLLAEGGDTFIERKKDEIYYYFSSETMPFLSKEEATARVERESAPFMEALASLAEKFSRLPPDIEIKGTEVREGSKTYTWELAATGIEIPWSGRDSIGVKIGDQRFKVERVAGEEKGIVIHVDEMGNPLGHEIKAESTPLRLANIVRIGRYQRPGETQSEYNGWVIMENVEGDKVRVAMDGKVSRLSYDLAGNNVEAGHARIEFFGETLQIWDLASANRTTVYLETAPSERASMAGIPIELQTRIDKIVESASSLPLTQGYLIPTIRDKATYLSNARNAADARNALSTLLNAIEQNQTKAREIGLEPASYGRVIEEIRPVLGELQLVVAEVGVPAPSPERASAAGGIYDSFARSLIANNEAVAQILSRNIKDEVDSRSRGGRMIPSAFIIGTEPNKGQMIRYENYKVYINEVTINQLTTLEVISLERLIRADYRPGGPRGSAAGAAGAGVTAPQAAIPLGIDQYPIDIFNLQNKYAHDVIRERESPRIIFIPINQTYVSPYIGIASTTSQIIQREGFQNVVIALYNGTKEDLAKQSESERVKKAMSAQNALTLVYTPEGGYGMVKGRDGVFAGLGERAQCIQENIQEGHYIDVYMHVKLGLGVLDAINHQLRGYEGEYDYRSLAELLSSMAELPPNLIAAINENPQNFFIDLLRGKHTIIMKINFRELDDMRRAIDQIRVAV